MSALGAIVIGPSLLWFARAPQSTQPEPMWDNLSVLTGLLALSAMVCATVLPSRIRSLNRALGIESVAELHRFLGIVTAALVLLHLAAVVALNPANVALLDIVHSPPRAQAAVVALVALVALVAAVAMRRRISASSYELWHWAHLALAVIVMIASALHVLWLDQMILEPTLALALGVLAAIVIGVLGHRWAWRRFYDPSTEFLVREVRRENATVSTLVLEPQRRRYDVSCGSWAFAPGQFAWIRLNRSVTAEEHPFTIASSAHVDTTEFTIRHTGDFTRTIRRLSPGSPVWVDGPHGAFTNDLGTCAGFVMISGGVGVTPMMSMVRTAADRQDPRAYRLVVVASSPEDLLFRDELAELRWHLDLEVTEVLRRPPEGWSGHTGDIDVGLLSAVLADTPHAEDLDYFICGPPALVTDTLEVLDALAVAPTRVHTEQFNFA